MNVLAASAPRRPVAPDAGHGEDPDDRPGACNIGPEEIRRRWLGGHLGVAVAAALLAALVLVGAPPITRLALVVPVAGAAVSYLQAYLRFCAAFGWRGIYNFGPLGKTHAVSDTRARARDRARSLRMSLAGLAIGVTVALTTVLLPV
jgi:hypothetical protein